MNYLTGAGVKSWTRWEGARHRAVCSECGMLPRPYARKANAAAAGRKHVADRHPAPDPAVPVPSPASSGRDPFVPWWAE